jgi:integrase
LRSPSTDPADTPDQPRPRWNIALWWREYLTEAEIGKLVDTAGESRNPGRDRLLILMAFRHALRVSELVDLRWQQVHLDSATIDIRRAKNGTPSIHGLQGDELRLLRALKHDTASIKGGVITHQEIERLEKLANDFERANSPLVQKG